MNARAVPLICQLFAHLDGAHALVYPEVAVTLTTIVLDGYLEGQLRVYHLVNALSTDFCQPLFYGFCFF